MRTLHNTPAIDLTKAVAPVSTTFFQLRFLQWPANLLQRGDATHAWPRQLRLTDERKLRTVL